MSDLLNCIIEEGRKNFGCLTVVQRCLNESFGESKFPDFTSQLRRERREEVEGGEIWRFRLI